MTLTLKKQIFFFNLAILLVIVSVGVFVVWPTIRHIQTLKAEIRSTQEYLEGRYQKARQVSRSLRELDRIEQAVGKYDQATLPIGSELTLITELEALAEKYNLEQSLKARFIQGDKKQPQAQFLFSFVQTGTFTDQMQYLRALETVPYYIVIDGLIWEKPKRVNATSTPVTLRFDGLVYATAAKNP